MLTLEWSGSSWSLHLVTHSDLPACPGVNSHQDKLVGINLVILHWVLFFLQASQGQQGSLEPGQSQRGCSRGQRQRSQLKAGGPAGKGASSG